MTRMRCIRGVATFAMKNAIGSASATSMSVTSRATPSVRSVTVWYSDPVSTVMMLSSVHSWLISPVKLSTVQNAVTSSSTSATM